MASEARLRSGRLRLRLERHAQTLLCRPTSDKLVNLRSLPAFRLVDLEDLRALVVWGQRKLESSGESIAADAEFTVRGLDMGPPRDAAMQDDAWRAALDAMRTTWQALFFSRNEQNETSASQVVALAQTE